MKRPFILVQFYLTLLSLMAKNVSVDSSLISSTNDSAPNLQTALNSLINPTNGQLLEQNNTITLLNNTINQSQLITNFTLKSTNLGSIQITSESLQTGISQPSYCSSNRPLVYISYTSVWDVEGLDTFLIEGVFLQTDVGNLTSSFKSINTVILQNICLQDNTSNNQTGRDPFDIEDVSYFGLINSTLLHSFGVGFLINNTQNATFENITIFKTGDASKSSYFGLNNTALAYPTISIQNVEIICTTSDYMTQAAIFDIWYLGAVTLSNLTMSNCNSLSCYSSMIQINYVSDFTANKITLPNINIYMLNAPTSYLQFISTLNSDVSISDVTIDEIFVFNYTVGQADVRFVYNYFGNEFTNISLTNITIQKLDIFWINFAICFGEARSRK